MTYNSADYLQNLEIGHIFQDHVMIELIKKGICLQCFASRQNQFKIGESIQGIEVKLDSRCTDTHRLSIEIGEKKATSNIWIPSGILRDDNSLFYVQGNYDIYFFFSKRTLKEYFKNTKPKIHYYNGTLRKFYIDFDVAKDLCEFWEETINKQ
ncbi:MAG: hypothetical protein R3C17_10670 [Planctomycetaceae bacterium]